MSNTTPSIPRSGADLDDVVGRARAHLTAPSGSLLSRIVSTEPRLSPAIARVVLGLVMLPHGLQKISTLFGGHGYAATYHGFTAHGIPGVLAFLVTVGEGLCAALLVLGCLSRVAVLGTIAIMIGAILLVHLPNGFFMNWMGQQAGEGFEYHLLAIALGLVVFLSGSGIASIDRLLMRRRPMPGGSVDDSFVHP